MAVIRMTEQRYHNGEQWVEGVKPGYPCSDYVLPPLEWKEPLDSSDAVELSYTPCDGKDCVCDSEVNSDE